jgi:hypothetical protein
MLANATAYGEAQLMASQLKDAVVGRSVVDHAMCSAASAVSPSAATSPSPRSPARSSRRTAPAPRTALARKSGSAYHRECRSGTGSGPADAEPRLRVAAESSWGTR